MTYRPAAAYSGFSASRCPGRRPAGRRIRRPRDHSGNANRARSAIGRAFCSARPRPQRDEKIAAVRPLLARPLIIVVGTFQKTDIHMKIRLLDPSGFRPAVEKGTGEIAE